MPGRSLSSSSRPFGRRASRAKLRDEATRAAKGAALNIAEAAGRSSRADRTRIFTIARGEAIEAVAAIELAVIAGDTTAEHGEACGCIGNRLYALLTGLIRR